MWERDNDRFYRSEAGVREYASYDHLLETEAHVLELLRSEGLARQRLLDLGVGGGRTSIHFAPHAREYYGVDFSAPLVEACRARFAGEDWPHVTWEVGDARALRHDDGFFDVAMFSWNGLDAVGGEENRLRALAEIHRVLKPGGRFFFSAHNLEYALAPASLRRTVVRRVLNPRLGSLRRRDSALVFDERVGWKWESHYYIRPAAQLGQLEGAGFTEAVALRPDGVAVAEPRAGEFASRHWLYYLCRA